MTRTADEYIEMNIEDICDPVHMDRVEMADEKSPAWMIVSGDDDDFMVFIKAMPLENGVAISIASFVDGIDTERGLTVEVGRQA